MTTLEFNKAVIAFAEDYRRRAFCEAFGIRCDGGPGSGNFEHEGRPGEIGGSAGGTGGSSSGTMLYHPSKGKMNKQINAIADASTRETVDEDVKKIGKLLDELEPRSVVTIPENFAGDEKYTYTKEDDGRWRGSNDDYGTWRSQDIAWDFLTDDQAERAYISKSAMSKQELEEDRAKEAAKIWRNQDSPWENGKPLEEKSDIKVTRDDLKIMPIGMKVTGKDGEVYENTYNGWVNPESGEISETKNIIGGTASGDYFDIHFGMNGVSGEEVETIRSAYWEMSDGAKAVYEKGFREHPVVHEKDDGVAYYDIVDGTVHLSTEQTAQTCIHEMSHAIDRGSVDLHYEGYGGYDIHITGASQNMDHLAGPSTSRYKEDFETMAKVIGYKTNGDGWFADDDERDGAFHQFLNWASKNEHKYGANGYEEVKGFDCVSDAISAMTLDFSKGTIAYGGHDQSYWRKPFNGRNTSNQSCEYWANYCTLRALKYHDALNLLKQVSPNQYAAAQATYKEAFKNGS